MFSSFAPHNYYQYRRTWSFRKSCSGISSYRVYLYIYGHVEFLWFFYDTVSSTQKGLRTGLIWLYYYIYGMAIIFASCYYILFSRTYVQYYNESGNITTGIFKGVINYNASELNGTDFVSVFEDGLWATYERDCSVTTYFMKNH